MKFATLPVITLALALGASAQTADQISCCKNYAAKGYTLELRSVYLNDGRYIFFDTLYLGGKL
ncbi:unnamed protein product [Clonostachys byssicola]|uniref:Uncharacterized protein n=1 Tax=Clonostachys byssicola TaxID=160290 RepID=A0A9N9U5W5_9HYPO|nr:unnamed protein product [Clonostachys byssicola]